MQKSLPSRRGRRRGLALLAIAALIILGGIVPWILTTRNVLPESWWGAVGATFTVVSVILTYTQLRRSKNTERASTAPVSSRRKGGLIVRASRQLCGSTVELCRGFETATRGADFAANIVERKTNGVAEYIGEFPPLEPGNYTACVHESALMAKVTVSSGHTAEIDWKHIHGTTVH